MERLMGHEEGSGRGIRTTVANTDVAMESVCLAVWLEHVRIHMWCACQVRGHLGLITKEMGKADALRLLEECYQLVKTVCPSERVIPSHWHGHCLRGLLAT